MSLLYQIVHEAPQPLIAMSSERGTAGGLQQVLSRALAKDPALRFSTIIDFAARAPRGGRAGARAGGGAPAVWPRRPGRAARCAGERPALERTRDHAGDPARPALAYRPIVMHAGGGSPAIGFVAAKGWIHPLPARWRHAAYALEARRLRAPRRRPRLVPVTGIGEAAPAGADAPCRSPPPAPPTAARTVTDGAGCLSADRPQLAADDRT